MNGKLKAAVSAAMVGSLLAASPVMATRPSTTGAPGASSGDEDRTSLAEGLGVGSGAAVGALVAGPVGVLVCAGLGAWLGSRVHQASAYDDVTADLAQAQESLQAQRHELDTLEDQRRTLSAELTARDREYLRVTHLAERAEAANEELRQALSRGLELQIMFRTGASDLDAAATEQLEQLARLLVDLDEVEVRLDGYTDPRGEEQFNDALAAERIARVRAVLLAAGLGEEQVTGFAHGERSYAAAEGDADAYAMARRVEISIAPGATAGPAVVAAATDEESLPLGERP